MEMCLRPPSTARPLAEGCGPGGWGVILSARSSLHLAPDTESAPPQPPRGGPGPQPPPTPPCPLQGVNGSRTYLRMSFLLKNVQSCGGKRTVSGAVGRLLLPQTRVGGSACGEQPWTVLGAEESQPPSLPHGPGDGCPVGRGIVS